MVSAQSGDAGTNFSLSQARALSAYALQNDRPDLALQLGKGLLKADARDPFAYFVIAQSYAALGQNTQGRRAAARAYRFAEARPDRMRAAQLAAQLAFAENRPSLTQVWLRRTAIHVDNPEDEAQLARDYRALRRINPWSLSCAQIFARPAT